MFDFSFLDLADFIHLSSAVTKWCVLEEGPEAIIARPSSTTNVHTSGYQQCLVTVLNHSRTSHKNMNTIHKGNTTGGWFGRYANQNVTTERQKTNR